ncbi:sulfotransferase family protein [Ancylobacter aquaticus]|uniref:Sulfotransferase family protein n=1 Tax=Ancylobacter aquaticus TaxID=100 RepID=A0A4R1I7Y4_ANCAQ|nr:sulfotransferase family 2 domain-containing protein [Ancylobacter aquaticus]TCK31128.1 sulfotransferase family protein [Ancylobacter aquaticus]
MIDHERKIIFVHIQKTGGTSITAHFGLPAELPEKHFTARELRDLYGRAQWDTYFTFSVVRNPWDRLVSWWSMIDAHRAGWQRGGRLNAFQTYVLERATTFEEFLAHCGDEVRDSDGAKSIYLNQIDYLVDETGALMVDRVCRFERLAEDFREVMDRTGIPGPLPVVNTSRRGDYRRYYTDETRALVAQIYARDIAFFGFGFDDGRIAPAAA